MRRLALCLLASVALLAAACGSSADTQMGSLQGKSAKQILALAYAAINHAGTSFHFVDQTKAGDKTVTLVGDDTTFGSDQVLSGDAPALEVRRGSSPLIYVRGAATALVDALGLSQAVASSHAGQWIVLNPSDGPYQKVATALGPQSEIGNFVPQNPLHLEASRPIAGHQVVDVVGAAPSAADAGAGATTTMIVPTEAPYTPLGAVLRFHHGSSSGTEAVLFGRWGEHVTEVVPTPVVQYGSLVGG